MRIVVNTHLLAFMALTAVMVSCGASTQRVIVSKRITPLSVIGFDPTQTVYGYWTGNVYYRNGYAPPYDTAWTLGMRNPEYLAYDDRFLLMKNAAGKMAIMTTTEMGKPVYKSTKSEVRYQLLRTELAVPESLVLQEIK